MPFVTEVGVAVQTRGEMTFEWKISDFLSLSDKVDNWYQSPVFSFADARWYLHLYPYGETKHSSAEWVGLYLMRGDSGPPKTVHHTFGIRSSSGVEKKEEFKSEFSKKNQGFGFPKCWSRSELRNWKSILLPNNGMTVTCDLRCSDVLCSFKGENKLGKSLLNMLESGDDSDVVIKVQGKEFPAHRGILRARSPVFRSMFTHDMVEKQSNVVNIEDGDPAAFPDFLVHIYTGRCEQISMKNVFSLYTAADKYDIGELKEACSEFMKRNITVANFCNVITLAKRLDDKELEECATTFFCDNSVDIVKSPDWLNFQNENLTVWNELFIKAMSK